MSDAYIKTGGSTLSQLGLPKCSPGSTTILPPTVTSMLANIRASSYIPSAKKDSCHSAAEALLNAGFSPAFVAGVLANIVYEGSVGQFESSAYANQAQRPDYLVYMDTYYSYRTLYSGRFIYNVNVTNVYNILTTLHNQGWRVGGSRAGFGLGSVQWTFERTYTLVKLYREVNGNSSTITLAQATRAEALMITRELQGPYRFVYSNWQSSNPNANTVTAAYNAGYAVCVSYEVPVDAATKGRVRGELAQRIFTDMMK